MENLLEIDSKIKELSELKEKIKKECTHKNYNTIDNLYCDSWDILSNSIEKHNKQFCCHVICSYCNKKVELKFKSVAEFKKLRAKNNKFTTDEYKLFDIVSENLIKAGYNTQNYVERYVKQLNDLKSSEELNKLLTISYERDFVDMFLNWLFPVTIENYKLLFKICPSIKIPDVDKNTNGNKFLRGNYHIYGIVFNGYKTYPEPNILRLEKSNHVFLKRILKTPKKISEVVIEGIKNYNLNNKKIKADSIFMEDGLFEELDFVCLPGFKFSTKEIMYIPANANYKNLNTPPITLRGTYKGMKVFVGNYSSRINRFMIINEFDLQLDHSKPFPRPSIYFIGEKNTQYCSGYEDLIDIEGPGKKTSEENG